MRVGEENVAYPMKCDHCGRQWLAVVEASKIEWSEFHIELYHNDLLECPDCGGWTEIDRDV
jgi:DNA-directed RNA polymerase subunit RPC12/RpoP